MKRKLQIINGLIFLMGAACVYMLIVALGGNAHIVHTFAFMCFLIINLLSQDLLWNYKFQSKICDAVTIFLFTVYLFFFTPTNAIALGMPLAIIGIINCFAVYFWVRYKKIPPDADTERTYGKIFNRIMFILLIALLAALMLIN